MASDEVRSSESSVLPEFPADSEHLQQPMTADETIERKNRVLACMMARNIILLIANFSINLLLGLRMRVFDLL